MARQRFHGLSEGYRSGLEEKIARELQEALGQPVEYEGRKLVYTKPARKTHYTPDFILPNGIIIETKGRFVSGDRQKHILISKEHPDLDLRFVFSRSKTRISKISQTTYGMWCEKNNFPYADVRVPHEWLTEPFCAKRWAAIERVTKQ